MDTLSADATRAVLWVERLSRNGEVLSRQRIDAEAFTIGRGYRNDVVIDDPHVAEHHLRLAYHDDGHWHAEDLGSHNGVQIGRRARTVRKHVVHGDEPLRVGTTWLRFRTLDHPVAGETPLQLRHKQWPAVAGLGVACVLLQLLEMWLQETDAPRPLHYLSITVALLAATALWAGFWSVIGRVFIGRARLLGHLIIALSGLLALGLYTDANAVLAYALSTSALLTYQFIGTGALVALVVFAHLRLIAPRHPLAAALIVGSLALIAIGMDTLRLHERRASAGPGTALRELSPPLLRLAPAESDADFFALNQGLQAEVNRARIDEQPRSGESTFDPDDED